MDVPWIFSHGESKKLGFQGAKTPKRFPNTEKTPTHLLSPLPQGVEPLLQCEVFLTYVGAFNVRTWAFVSWDYPIKTKIFKPGIQLVAVLQLKTDLNNIQIGWVQTSMDLLNLLLFRCPLFGWNLYLVIVKCDGRYSGAGKVRILVHVVSGFVHLEENKPCIFIFHQGVPSLILQKNTRKFVMLKKLTCMLWMIAVIS